MSAVLWNPGSGELGGWTVITEHPAWYQLSLSPGYFSGQRNVTLLAWSLGCSLNCAFLGTDHRWGHRFGIGCLYSVNIHSSVVRQCVTRKGWDFPQVHMVERGTSYCSVTHTHTHTHTHTRLHELSSSLVYNDINGGRTWENDVKNQVSAVGLLRSWNF
jgi:hypothetical protein